jgi:hypothetical protein
MGGRQIELLRRTLGPKGQEVIGDGDNCLMNSLKIYVNTKHY